MPDLDQEAAALIEPLSIGCHAVGRGRPTPEDRTLVIGAGPIGLATAQFAALAGAPLTVVDLSERRRATVAAIVPAATVVDAVPADDRFDCVFDATGSAASMMRAFDYVAAGGRLVYVGLTLEPLTIDDVELHRREMTVLASRNATPADFERVIAAVRGGHIDPRAWITHRLSLETLPQAFDDVRGRPGADQGDRDALIARSGHDRGPGIPWPGTPTPVRRGPDLAPPLLLEAQMRQAI